MAAKTDINLFRAAGGGRTKAKKKPITFYLGILIVVVLIACGVLVAYFYFDVSKLQSKLDVLEDTRDSILITQKTTGKLGEEYSSIKSGIDNAELISDTLAMVSCRYPQCTAEEVNAIATFIESKGCKINRDNSNDADYIAEEYDFEQIKKLVQYDESTEGRNTYSTWVDIFNQFEAEQAETFDVLWYTYYRGQMVIITENANATVLTELTSDFLQGFIVDGIEYAPFSQMYVNGEELPYDNTDAVILSGTNEEDESVISYGIMILPLKSIEERAIDILDSKVEELAIINADNWGEDDFRYDITKMTYSPGILTIELKILNTSKMNPNYVNLSYYLDALRTSGFFKISNEVTYPNTYTDEYVTYEVILEIVGATEIK